MYTIVHISTRDNKRAWIILLNPNLSCRVTCVLSFVTDEQHGTNTSITRRRIVKNIYIFQLLGDKICIADEIIYLSSLYY
jgi:hypothetical protein